MTVFSLLRQGFIVWLGACYTAQVDLKFTEILLPPGSAGVQGATTLDRMAFCAWLLLVCSAVGSPAVNLMEDPLS